MLTGAGGATVSFRMMCGAVWVRCGWRVGQASSAQKWLGLSGVKALRAIFNYPKSGLPEYLEVRPDFWCN